MLDRAGKCIQGAVHPNCSKKSKGACCKNVRETVKSIGRIIPARGAGFSTRKGHASSSLRELGNM
jgi:hypothetical protein